MLNWISVKRLMPNMYESVLVADGPNIYIANNQEEEKPAFYRDVDDQYLPGVTHWMPLPELPNQFTTTQKEP